MQGGQRVACVAALAAAAALLTFGWNTPHGETVLPVTLPTPPSPSRQPPLPAPTSPVPAPPAPVFPVAADLTTARFADLPAYRPINYTELTSLPTTSHHRFFSLPLSPDPVTAIHPCYPATLPQRDAPPVVLWVPEIPRMSQNPVSCPVSCALESRHDKVQSADAFVVDLAREWLHDWRIYDWKANPLKKTLVAWNIENIEGRRRKLAKAYKHRYIGAKWNDSFWELFDLAVSYPLGSDVPLNYYNWAVCRDESTSAALKRFHSPYVKHVRDAAVFFSSNCEFTSHWRDAVVLKLRDIFPVHGYGKCLHTHSVFDAPWCKAVTKSRRGVIKACVMSGYPFAIIIENSISIDYVTEKVYEPLFAGAVPVYLGAPNVENFLPTSHSVIKISDFPSLSALGKYLRCLLRHPDQLKVYQSWKERKPFESWEVMRRSYPPLCNVCMAISDAKQRGKPLNLSKPRRPRVVPYVFDENRGSQAPLPRCFAEATKL
eukprot:Sspe_Gene.70519::Locus_41644_Transcript_2_2_Confidence_0.667_Length_1792::g.70519::m.70519